MLKTLWQKGAGISSFLVVTTLTVFLIPLLQANAILVTSPPRSIQTGDVTSTTILDGTILNVDISSAARIDAFKIFPGGGGGALLFESYGRIGSSTALTFATTTNRLGIGTTSPQANLGIAGSLGVNSTHLILSSGGNVGIGTTTPSDLLGIHGGGIVLSNNQNISFEDSGGAKRSIINVSAADNVTIDTPPSGDMYLSDADTFILKSTGRVGINVTSPANKLVVGGEVAIGSAFNVAAPTNGLIVQGFVGIGTTSPYTKLSVVGEIVGEKFTATSTTATSTFSGGLTAQTASSSVMIISNKCTGCTNISQVSNTGASPTTQGGAATVTATCPAGKVATGGGISGGAATVDIVQRDSQPNSTNAWDFVATCRSASCSSFTMTSYVVCANQ